AIPRSNPRSSRTSGTSRRSRVPSSPCSAGSTRTSLRPRSSKFPVASCQLPVKTGLCWQLTTGNLETRTRTASPSPSLATRAPREIVLSAPAPASPTHRLGAEHLLDFEAMKAVPDQLVTYFFWAEDVGPDGQPRRASGDLYFAEVRHFEEIFRQGEQPPAGSA